MVEEYEEEAALVKDATQRKKMNPYHLVEKGMFNLHTAILIADDRTTGLTEMSVRLQFSEEEAANEKKGVPSLHNVSPSTFVYVGLELEDEQ
jgi:poly(3-hydroxyalkanoate) synthetase